ncbi:MAG: ABC transporter ATP-binding protein [Acidobacteria bacterium]|nr:ABC transporter ATP-binding protein [Acidobacteriota bacterium]
MDPLIHLEDAGVSLGGKPILRHVEFELQPGQVVGIAGPNGSGKTTLIRVLATLLRISEGTGSVLGADVNSDQVFRVRPSIGMIGHNPALIGELTLLENLIHIARLAGVAEERVGTVLEVVGLSEASDRRADASSFGMRRRIEVAHLLLTRPRLVLLDEATSGLDNSARELINALRDRTVADGGGVVMVSHDEKQLAETCEEVMGLASGRLVNAQ